MATLEQRIVALAQAVGADVKTLRNSIGILSNLTTVAKGDIVTALNEVVGKTTTNTNSISTLNTAVTNLQNGLAAIDLTQIINDAAGAGVINKTYSVDKILTLITAVKAEILDGAPEALNTLQELSAALGSNPNLATDIATALASRVRVDAVQTFTSIEQGQARSNISAASVAEVGAAQAAAATAQAGVNAINTKLGDTDHDYTVDYVTAKT